MFSKRSLAVVATLVVAGGLATTGIATAVSGSSDHLFYACQKDGAVNASTITYDKVPSCPGKTTLISWNEQGPTGPAGPAGSGISALKHVEQAPVVDVWGLQPEQVLSLSVPVSGTDAVMVRVSTAVGDFTAFDTAHGCAYVDSPANDPIKPSHEFDLLVDGQSVGGVGVQQDDTTTVMLSPGAHTVSVDYHPADCSGGFEVVGDQAGALPPVGVAAEVL